MTCFDLQGTFFTKKRPSFPKKMTSFDLSNIFWKIWVKSCIRPKLPQMASWLENFSVEKKNFDH